MLQLSSSEPVRIRLAEGAWAVLKPIETPDWLKAQRAARAVVAAAEEGDPDVGIRTRTALIHSLVHGGLQSLEGVADVDGSPIEGRPTEAQINRLLGWWPAYSALEAEYVGPILEADAEKNGLSPSQGGSSTPRAATSTAADASPDSPAKAAAKPAPAE